MAVSYNKPAGMKYTDMCIYIDENMKYTLNNGEYPDIENKIFEYFYHILYALACKDNYFNNFSDYDSFAMYGASELYLSLRSRYINVGKEVRGKIVEPVKSCLNFIKSVLLPLKVNYQRQTYATILNPEVGQDTSIIAQDMKDSIKSDYRSSLEDDVKEIANDLPRLINKVIDTTPYRSNMVYRKKLYMSIALTFLNDITIPNKIRNKLKRKSSSLKDSDVITAYKTNLTEVILWHLDPTLEDYIRLLVTKVKHLFTDSLHEARSYGDLSDEVVDSIMKTAYATFEDREDN